MREGKAVSGAPGTGGTCAVEALLVLADPVPGWLARLLDQTGHGWVAAADVSAADRLEPDDGWAGAVVAPKPGRDDGLVLCRSLRKREPPVAPVLLVLGEEALSVLGPCEDLFDDFVLDSASPGEFEARLARLLWRSRRGSRHEVIVYGPLALNLETYQAGLDGRPLDLTYMEYELLRYLAAHPGRVFTREVLLSRVWGYEYFGGARTVDVHVRRLRAKLGEEHAHLIETVRSVGYRFGSVRWLPGQRGR